MISKRKIRQLISLNKEVNGFLQLSHIPRKVLYSTEELHGLYYGGWYKIEIGKYFSSGADSFEITNQNLEEVVNKVHALLNDNIGHHLIEALENLGMDDTQTKYFEREPKNYKKYKAEVLRLIKEEKEGPILDTMDIYSPYGTRVIYTGKNGYDSDKEYADEFLKIGEVYTVKYTDVGSLSTRVCFIEFPDKEFNSVHFIEE